MVLADVPRGVAVVAPAPALDVQKGAAAAHQRGARRSPRVHIVTNRALMVTAMRGPRVMTAMHGQPPVATVTHARPHAVSVQINQPVRMATSRAPTATVMQDPRRAGIVMSARRVPIQTARVKKVAVPVQAQTTVPTAHRAVISVMRVTRRARPARHGLLARAANTPSASRLKAALKKPGKTKPPVAARPGLAQTALALRLRRVYAFRRICGDSMR